MRICIFKGRKEQQRIPSATNSLIGLAERKLATIQSASIPLEMAGLKGGAKVTLPLERRKNLGLASGSITADDLRGDKQDLRYSRHRLDQIAGSHSLSRPLS